VIYKGGLKKEDMDGGEDICTNMVWSLMTRDWYGRRNGGDMWFSSISDGVLKGCLRIRRIVQE